MLEKHLISRKYGLYDHYFLVYDNIEHHLGEYDLGNILPLGTTVGSHCTEKYLMCKSCFEDFKYKLCCKVDRVLFNTWYPLVNCETLSMGVGISIIICLVGTVFSISQLLMRNYMIAFIIILITIIVYLMYSKYQYSKCSVGECAHIIYAKTTKS